MKTRSWITIAVAGGMASALAGSAVLAQAPATADTVELTVLANAIKGGKNDRQAVFIEDVLIPAFEAEMEAAGTPVSVTFEGRGVDDEPFKQQLALDLDAGGGSDLINIDGPWVGEMALAGLIAPLTDIVGADADDWEGWEQINDAVQANASFAGDRYGIPGGTDGRVIYFNKELFAEAGLPEDWQPTTVEEVLDAARTVQAELDGVIPLQLNGGVAMGEATTMQGALPLLAGAGGEVYDIDAELWNGSTDALVTMLETYATIYADEELGDVELQLLTDGRDRSFEAFANREIAMLVEGDFFWRSVIHPDAPNFAMEDRDEVVGWAMIPAYEPGGALGGHDFASMGGGGLWVINPNAEHPAEAWELLKFMNTPEMVVEGLDGQPRITARDDVNAEILADDPLLSFIATEVLPVNHYRPSLPEYPQVSIALQEAVEAVVTGTSPEDAAAAYQEAVAGIVGEDNVSD